jgi:hypothetical protein
VMNFAITKRLVPASHWTCNGFAPVT